MRRLLAHRNGDSVTASSTGVSDGRFMENSGTGSSSDKPSVTHFGSSASIASEKAPAAAASSAALLPLSSNKVDNDLVVDHNDATISRPGTNTTSNDDRGQQQQQRSRPQTQRQCSQRSTSSNDSSHSHRHNKVLASSATTTTTTTPTSGNRLLGSRIAQRLRQRSDSSAVALVASSSSSVIDHPHVQQQQQQHHQTMTHSQGKQEASSTTGTSSVATTTAGVGIVGRGLSRLRNRRSSPTNSTNNNNTNASSGIATTTSTVTPLSLDGNCNNTRLSSLLPTPLATSTTSGENHHHQSRDQRHHGYHGHHHSSPASLAPHNKDGGTQCNKKGSPHSSWTNVTSSVTLSDAVPPQQSSTPASVANGGGEKKQLVSSSLVASPASPSAKSRSSAGNSHVISPNSSFGSPVRGTYAGNSNDPSTMMMTMPHFSPSKHPTPPIVLELREQLNSRKSELVGLVKRKQSQGQTIHALRRTLAQLHMQSKTTAYDSGKTMFSLQAANAAQGMNSDRKATTTTAMLSPLSMEQDAQHLDQYIRLTLRLEEEFVVLQEDFLHRHLIPPQVPLYSHKARRRKQDILQERHHHDATSDRQSSSSQEQEQGGDVRAPAPPPQDKQEKGYGTETDADTNTTSSMLSEVTLDPSSSSLSQGQSLPSLQPLSMMDMDLGRSTSISASLERATSSGGIIGSPSASQRRRVLKGSKNNKGPPFPSSLSPSSSVGMRRQTSNDNNNGEDQQSNNTKVASGTAMTSSSSSSLSKQSTLVWLDAVEVGLLKKHALDNRMAITQTKKQIAYLKQICDQIVSSLKDELVDVAKAHQLTNQDMQQQLQMVTRDKSTLEEHFQTNVVCKEEIARELQNDVQTKKAANKALKEAIAELQSSTAHLELELMNQLTQLNDLHVQKEESYRSEMTQKKRRIAMLEEELSYLQQQYLVSGLVMDQTHLRQVISQEHSQSYDAHELLLEEEDEERQRRKHFGDNHTHYFEQSSAIEEGRRISWKELYSNLQRVRRILSLLTQNEEETIPLTCTSSLLDEASTILDRILVQRTSSTIFGSSDCDKNTVTTTKLSTLEEGVPAASSGAEDSSSTSDSYSKGVSAANLLCSSSPSLKRAMMSARLDVQLHELALQALREDQHHLLKKKVHMMNQGQRTMMF